MARFRAVGVFLFIFAGCLGAKGIIPDDRITWDYVQSSGSQGASQVVTYERIRVWCGGKSKKMFLILNS